MEAVVITCSICSEYYKSTDEIYSTSCGHVFHSHCILEWQNRSSQCPACRTYNSGSKKIYLNFEGNSHEKDKKIEELKSQLEQSLLNASILQQNLDDSERDFLNIHKQLTEYEELINEVNKKNEYLVLQNDSREKDIANKIVEIHRLQEALNAFQGSSVELQEEINVLNEKLKQITLTAMHTITSRERDFLNIQKQLTEYEELINELNKKNEYLVLQNDSREKDIAIKIVEIDRLQDALNATCSMLHEINVLNEKLKQITLKLQREIHNTTQLEFDKMKLQSVLDHAIKTIQNTEERNQISIGGGGNNTNQHSYGASGVGASGGGAYNNKLRNNFNKTAILNDGWSRSIIIQNIKETFIEESSMMAYVPKLIKLMNLSLRDEDIQHVSIFERNNSETASLLVKFKLASAVGMFLSNKRKLQNYENLKDLIIMGYARYLLNTKFMPRNEI